MHIKNSPFKNIDPPGDIMRGGSRYDVDLNFAHTNADLLRAAIGTIGNGDLPLTAALKMYRANFNLAASEVGIREAEVPDDQLRPGLLVTLPNDDILPGDSVQLRATTADGANGSFEEQNFTLLNSGLARCCSPAHRSLGT
jgi:hypothetical protein